MLPLLQEKALNLLTAVTLFLVSTLDYFSRGLVRQIAKSVFRGVDVWQKRVAELHLACEEYDQALLLQVASSILGQSQKPETALGEDAKLRSWLQPSIAENESKRMASLAQRTNGTLQMGAHHARTQGLAAR